MRVCFFNLVVCFIIILEVHCGYTYLMISVQ